MRLSEEEAQKARTTALEDIRARLATLWEGRTV
jgi:hypothetical protein